MLETAAIIFVVLAIVMAWPLLAFAGAMLLAVGASVVVVMLFAKYPEATLASVLMLAALAAPVWLLDRAHKYFRKRSVK